MAIDKPFATQRLLDSARTICTLLRDEQWDMRASTFAKAYADLQASITSFALSESGGRHPTLNFDVQSPMGLDDSSPKTDPINVHGAMAAGKDRPYTQSAAALITDIRNDAEADAVGVDRFRTAMSNKLAKKREDGRGGWNHEPYTVQPDRGDRVQRFGCEVSYLRRLLREHVEKGDMVDIANLAMMIWNRENPRG